MSISSTSPSSRRVVSDPRLGELIAGDAVITHQLPGEDGLESFSARKSRGPEVLVRFLPMEFATSPTADRLDVVLRGIAGVQSMAAVVDSSVTVDGLPYVAYAVDGESLEEYIAHAGPLNVVDALYLTLLLTRALEQLHARGVAHGHLTPSNVFRTDFGELLIVDAGVAVLAAQSTPPLVSLLSGQAVVGNPAFMAPELLGRGSAGAEADVYGVGAILYFLLTGCPPFDGQTVLERAKRVTGMMPPRLADIADSVPAELEELFARIMVKEPMLRIASSNELAQALEQACRRSGSRVFEYHRSESGLAPRPIEPRHVTIPKAPRLPHHQTPEPPISITAQPQRSNTWLPMVALGALGALLALLLGAYLMTK